MRASRRTTEQAVTLDLPRSATDAAAAALGPLRWEASRGEPAIREGAIDRSVLRREALFRRSLALVDVVALSTALVTAVMIFGGGGRSLRPTSLLALPLVVLISKAMGLYDRDQHLLRKTTIDEVPAILQVSVLMALLVWLGEDVLATGDLGRSEVFGIALGAFVLTVAGRVAARSLALRYSAVERCVVLGNAGTAARLAAKLDVAPRVKASVIGRVGFDEGPHREFANCPPLLGHVRVLGLILAEHEVERVLIAPDGHDQAEVLHAIRLIKALGVQVSVVPQLLEVVGSSSTFDEVDGLTLLGVRRYGLTKSSQFLKRALDLAASATGLLLLTPLLLMLAIAIKLDSRGPVFFRQRRIGRRGQEFAILKFRSMVPGAEGMKDALRDHNEAEGLFKISDDPRITRVGRFLRKTSLDELPQLINVLRGEMSLIGPRPERPEFVELFESDIRRYGDRHRVKSGVTGWAQVHGLRGQTSLTDRVEWDNYYIEHWTLGLDVKILALTVLAVLRSAE
jgi:exopolysaccharide biosynthesis polyprenyl glycosylphosphotransferase